MKRTQYCGEVTGKSAGERVSLCGWVQRRRDHGGLIFIDLRDRTGLVQLVFDPKISGDAFPLAEKARPEYVLSATGKVESRPEGSENPNMVTGEIEIYIDDMEILNAAKTPPFQIEDGVEVDEMVRLKYRYLDLRRPEMQKNFILRHRLTIEMRKFLDAQGFLEIETPMLTGSTPEGARDYLVPSRVHPGEFFALPQSPQQFKQLLMVAGMDKYFQIVRCFRDEDLRADRQPEFTQLDIEMSFVDREDIIAMTERMMVYIYEAVLGKKLEMPFLRLEYDEAMDRFGSDKPDLRFDLELKDITEEVKGCDFKVFASVAAGNGVVKGINAKGCGKYSRKDLEDLTKYAGIFGARGMAWFIITEDREVKSPIAKFFNEAQLATILNKLEAEPGDLLLFVADKKMVARNALGNLRLEIARRENLIAGDVDRFLWVTDFPLLEYDEEEKRYTAMHHPFTSPRDEDADILLDKPDEVKAKAYDLVLNGVELGGGSIRIHRREMQEKMFQLLGFTKESANEKFGYLLNAFEYGTPPHGGIAFGVDRMVMLMTARDTIRDVIAFPKTQSAACLMTDAPNAVAPKQLRELSIALDLPEKKKD